MREHADDVFDFIIKPALDELGIHGYRADHTQEPGKITEQMIHSILSEDFVIAVLTYHNPNVFYELAIAQSAGRPVISMIEKGQYLPFDIHDMRTIEYDLKPRPINEGIYKKQIVERISALRSSSRSPQVPFGQNLSPLGQSSGGLSAYEKAEKIVTSDFWFDMVTKAQTHIDILGVSMRGWTQYRELMDEFQRASDRNVKVRIMIMDSENDALPVWLNTHHTTSNSVRIVQEMISEANKIYEDLAARSENIIFRKLKRGIPHQQLVRSDQEMCVVMYLFSANTPQSPLILAHYDDPIYKSCFSEFEYLWHLNAPSE